jgi:hypothetical protein
MRTMFSLWAFGALGALLLLASVGIGVHPVYRVALMAAILCWCGCYAWSGTISTSRHE